MIRNMISEMLSHLGLQIENRDARPPPGVTPVNDRAGISAVFLADAARQKAGSAFFSDGTQPRVVIPTNARELGAGPSPRRSDTWLQ